MYLQFSEHSSTVVIDNYTRINSKLLTVVCPLHVEADRFKEDEKREWLFLAKLHGAFVHGYYCRDLLITN